VTSETVEGFRLSPQQSRLWALQERDGAAPYRTRGVIAIEGDVDSARLRDALEAVAQRHEILRTEFPLLTGMGTPLQAIRDRLPIAFAEGNDAAVDPNNAAVVRARLLRPSPGRSELILDLPALCADTTTLEQIVSELSALYADPSAGEGLGEVLQYPDVAEWFHDLLDKPESAPGIAYWRRIDLPAASSSRLPFETGAAGERPFEPGSFPFTLAASTRERIAQVSRELGVSPRTLLLTCWQVLLARLTDDPALVVGYATAGRPLEELRSAMGLCGRYLPLRGDLQGDPTFAVAVSRVDRAVRDQEPWAELFTWEVHRGGDARGPALFLPFVFDYAASASAGNGGLTFRLEEQQARIDRFTLRLACAAMETGLRMRIDYDANRLGGDEIERLAARLRRILESAVANPDVSVGRLKILADEERRRLCHALNGTRREFPDDRPIHERFEEAASRAPDDEAVSGDGGRLTYAELNERANRLAHVLIEAGIGPESLVGLCVERSIEMIVGVLAIWKAGGAYVPLDPSLPDERLAFLLDDTGASPVLTRAALAGRFAARAGIVLLDANPDAPATNPPHRSRPGNLAYVIFTSGSTGRPKGVAVEHRQIGNYVSAILEVLKPGRGAGFATVTTLAADLGNTAIFPSLASGGRLRVVSEARAVDPEGLAEDFERDPVDYLKIVPSHLAALLAASRPERLLPRRCLVLGGEASSWDLLERVRALAPSCRIVNHYGPTEATVGATTFSFPESFESGRPQTVPIGQPLANCRVVLLDARGQMVPFGVPGELHIGGAGLARGYWRRPELTAEAFPVIDVDGKGVRLYKTGDLARYLPDGTLELLGRTDDQIKLHGFRIEPGEIEAALRRHPAIEGAVVLPRESPGAARRLVAYVVVPGDETPAAAELREFLARTLPEFMIPSAFVRLHRLPLTPNGKVDRAALPIPDPTIPGGGESIVAPRTREEKILAKVWADVLRADAFGVHDNFFDLGGDSILAMQIVARAAREGLRLTPRQLFERQTIAELAEAAEGPAAGRAAEGPVTGPVPLTPIQHWFFEQDLADPHHFNQSMLIEAREPIDPRALETAVEALVEHHDALRLRFTRDASGWRQAAAPPERGGTFSLRPLHGMDERGQAEAIARAAEEAQGSLDLARGPLARAVLFDRGPDTPARLLLIVHHLAVDVVSWRVLLEDLESAYRQARAGASPALPKTSSFREWAETLAGVAASGSLERETAYWSSRGDSPAAALPNDADGENTVGSERIIESLFTEAETRALLTEVPAAYRTQINDALLAALAKALAGATGSRSVRIGLEGHGREEVAPGIDLARTVGWFTARFPVLLELPEGAGPGESLIAVKEQLRAIPQRGVGYGLLRYLATSAGARGRWASLPEPAVSFNYYGQVDRLLPEDSLWTVLPSIGSPRSPRNRRRYPLAVDGRVHEGRLRLSWMYSENLHERATIERLAEGFERALRAVIAHCLSADVRSYTPSDFPRANLSQKDLDSLVETLKAGTAGRLPVTREPSTPRGATRGRGGAPDPRG